MKLFNFFKKEKRTIQKLDYVKPYSDGSLFFTYYDNGQALGLSTVFAAVDIISNSIAELPIQVIEQNGEENTILPDTNNITTLFNTMSISKFIAMKQVIVDMLLYGNGYIYIRRDTNGNPIELMFLPHGTITIEYTTTNGKLVYLYSGGNKSISSTILPKDILHFYKNSVDGIHGKGILQYANRTIKIGNYTEEAAKDYFGSKTSQKCLIYLNKQESKLLYQMVENGFGHCQKRKLRNY